MRERWTRRLGTGTRHSRLCRDSGIIPLTGCAKLSLDALRSETSLANWSRGGTMLERSCVARGQRAERLQH